MSTKYQKPEQLEKDYEDRSHVQRKKKAAFTQTVVRKSHKELYDVCGFDDEDDAQPYIHYLRKS